jgi:hypothetical protein
VVDRFGAPLEGATVKLSGLVDRKAISNAAGIVSFEALPDGRYDVVAESGALAPSAPHVVDLTAFRLTSVEVTLKPRSPTGRAMIACGGFDARSLSTLAATAHLVVHVKVLKQQTIEPPPDDERSPLASTVNLVEVREWFIHASDARPAGPMLLVRQGGGRIDRGDHVEYHHANQLPPLNPGDEYVLFLYTHMGQHTIHGSEEGTFRVRNGRVEPLGRAGAATDWTHRSVRHFFDALRAPSIRDSRIRD